MTDQRRFAAIIRSARAEEFPSAKAFWNARRPGCSYYQYSLIEKGTDLPSAALAAEIIKLLCLDLKTVMVAWVKDLMPTNDLRNLFSDPDDDPLIDPLEVKALISADANEAPLVINRMQAKLLIEKPRLHEMLSYMYTYACSRTVFSTTDIAEAVGISERDAREYLEELYGQGLVDLAGAGGFSCKRHFTIPAEPDLEPLQRQVFRRAVENFEEAMTADSETRPIRATLTRLFTPDQHAAVGQRLRALRNWVWSLPEISTPDAKAHTIGIFGAERRFR